MQSDFVRFQEWRTLHNGITSGDTDAPQTLNDHILAILEVAPAATAVALLGALVVVPAMLRFTTFHYYYFLHRVLLLFNNGLLLFTIPYYSLLPF